MDRIEGLRAYARVVELGSFSAAARDLRIGQSTVSKWVAQLEDEIGRQLLNRTTRAVSATEEGRAFYRDAVEILASWDRALSRARDAGALAGRVRVSAPVVFGRLYVCEAIGDWLRVNPGVELDLLFSDHYVDLVEEGVDLAIRVGSPVDSAYKASLIARTGRALVASPAYLEARGRPATPRDLEAHACLLHRGLDNREVWSFERGGERQAVEVRGRFSANHSWTLARMAERGEGIALLGDWLVRDALERGALERLLPEWSPPGAPVRAVLASTRHVSPRVRALLEFLRERISAELAV